MSTTRTPEEIVARIEAIAAEDWLGFAREVLMSALPYEHARQYLKDDVTAEDWAEIIAKRTTAREYFDFAVTKILDHRGISASRSVDKLREHAWLAGRDDVVDAMDSADYPQYGAPKVKAFADGMGFGWPEDTELARMAGGDACEPGCEMGCGL